MSDRSASRPVAAPAVKKEAPGTIMRIANWIAVMPAKGPNWISGTLLMGIMFLVTLDVFLRFVFGEPILGTYEIVQLAMVCAVYSAVCYSQMQRRFIAVDIIAGRFPKRVLAALDAFGYLIAMVLWSLAIWQSIKHGLELKVAHQITIARHIPIWPFYVVLAVGAGFLVVVLLANFIQILPKIKKGGD